MQSCLESGKALQGLAKEEGGEQVTPSMSRASPERRTSACLVGEGWKHAEVASHRGGEIVVCIPRAVTVG